MPRPKPTRYNGQQEAFVRMEARGATRPEILKAVFGLSDDASDDEKHAADCKMSRWRKFPCYDEVWKDEVKRVSYAIAGRALRKIDSQIDNENDWLANKAANDALSFSKGQIYGDAERSITVQIEGLPDLGTPDNDDV